MSTRILITTIAVLAALLTLPVFASARPISEPIAVHAKAQPAAIVAQPASTGTDTTTVVLIAGLTLLAGAAVGFEGARVVRRRSLHTA